MDEKTTRTILKLLPQFRLWQIEEYIMLSSYAALIYYYMTTFREEVAHIWPQKRTLGKILFLTTRYAAIGSMTAMLLTNWRNYMVISIPGCQAIVYIQNVVTEICRTSAEATLWLCLYALLEGKRRYFWILIVVFLSFTIPILTLELHNVLTQKAVERSILDDLLGYPCNYEPGLHPSHESIANYISFARTALALIAGLVTIVRRYRKQNHNLIRVIKREGGFYYISALIFRFLGSISMTEGSAITDDYGIFVALRWLLILVFVDRLLLQMRKVDDPGTQAVISTLIFQHDNRSADSTDSSDLDDEVDDSDIPSSASTEGSDVRGGRVETEKEKELVGAGTSMV